MAVLFLPGDLHLADFTCTRLEGQLVTAQEAPDGARVGLSASRQGSP